MKIGLTLLSVGMIAAAATAADRNYDVFEYTGNGLMQHGKKNNGRTPSESTDLLYSTAFDAYVTGVVCTDLTGATMGQDMWSQYQTGWTRTARHCFAGRVQSNGKVIFVGLMGSQRRQYLWSDLRRIESISTGEMPKPIVSAPAMPTRKETLKIQKALQRAGYFKGNPTGFYGKRTQAAVRNFQKSKGFSATGWVGPDTWKKLKAYL